MFNLKILKQSFYFSTLAVLYISFVTVVMRNASHLFGSDNIENKSFIGPVVFLLLIVISVAMMGMLIFGKPVMLYIDGKKREAVAMIVSTIGCLVIYLTLLFLIVLASRFFT